MHIHRLGMQPPPETTTIISGGAATPRDCHSSIISGGAATPRDCHIVNAAPFPNPRTMAEGIQANIGLAGGGIRAPPCFWPIGDGTPMDPCGPSQANGRHGGWVARWSKVSAMVQGLAPGSPLPPPPPSPFPLPIGPSVWMPIGPSVL